MKISLDWDDVLYNLSSLTIDYMKKRYNKEVTTNEMNTFNFFESNNYSDIIEDLFNNHKEYSKSSLLKGANYFYYSLADLVHENNIQIVTASMPNVIPFKEKYILDMLGWKYDIIHSNEKYKYTKGTILIDDAPKNILLHVDKNKNPGIIFDLDSNYGWNKNLKENNKTIFRATNYNETLDIVKKLI